VSHSVGATTMVVLTPDALAGLLTSTAGANAKQAISANAM